MTTARILLVDNDPHFRHSLAEDVLALEGYTVFQAASPQAAYALLEQHLIHLAIVDMRLTNDDNPHDHSGIEFCAELPPTIPRLILTGHPEWDVVRNAMQPNANGYRVADGFLFKGEGPAGVLAEVQRLLQAEFEIIPQRRIAVLTSGADSPGMNAAIRAIVRTALDQAMEVIGVEGGYQGLVNDRMRKLTWHDVHDIMVQNGAVLDAGRFPAFQNALVRKSAVQNLVSKHISALVVIGGDGSLQGAHALAQSFAEQGKAIQVIGLPGTIDNDLAGTDISLGATSVADAMIEELRHLLRHSQGRGRIYVIEAPGRYCGYLTLQAALGIAADDAIIPEEVISVYPPLNVDDAYQWQTRVNIDKTTATFLARLESIALRLETGFAAGDRHSFVLISEGIAQLTGGLLNGPYVRRYLEERIRQWTGPHRPEVRTHILGFPVRGVPPGRFDIWLGARLGTAAVKAIVAGKNAIMIGCAQDQQLCETPFAAVIEKCGRPPTESDQEPPTWVKQHPELKELLTRPPQLQHPMVLKRSNFEQRLRLRYKSHTGVTAQQATSPITINPDEVYTTIHKNSVSSYGLTLVAGMPFPATISEQIKEKQERLDRCAPDRFIWYSSDHLHITLVPLVRGRYREAQPVRSTELAADLPNYICRLNSALSQVQPFTLALGCPTITPGGSVIIKVSETTQRIVPALRQSLALDQPPANVHLHISIGYLNTPMLFNEEAEQQRFEEGYAYLSECPLGGFTVEQIWLVHYANRMLNRIVGKIPLTLGQPDQLTVDQLLENLRFS
jgi:6-phosphofructokinase 1